MEKIIIENINHMSTCDWKQLQRNIVALIHENDYPIVNIYCEEAD